jgi:hypothetical protein
MIPSRGGSAADAHAVSRQAHSGRTREARFDQTTGGVPAFCGAGAPGWLNLVVLVLAWDAIKFAVMTCLTSGRYVASAVGGLRLSHGRPVCP